MGPHSSIRRSSRRSSRWTSSSRFRTTRHCPRCPCRILASARRLAIEAGNNADANEMLSCNLCQPDECMAVRLALRRAGQRNAMRDLGSQKTETVERDRRDRFGNLFASGLPYARGQILKETADDYRKLRHAWRLVAERRTTLGPESIFNLSGLNRGLTPDPLLVYDDELSPALYLDRLTDLALRHLGGTPDRHDVALFNRQSAALLAAVLALVRRGQTIVGASPSYSHPAVTRPVALVGARFVDAVGREGFQAALDREPQIDAVVLTRLSVSYEILSSADLAHVIRLARARGALIIVDDAGGARVGPAVFKQPRMLELDVDVGTTGLDKYGTLGPRLGLLGGKRQLVEVIRSRAFEYGLEARPMLYPAAVRSLEQYTEARVNRLVACTADVARELEAIFGNRVRRTPVAVQLLADDILELAVERAGIAARPAPVVPYEATGAVAMLLLSDHGILTVHFAAMPPGTSALLFKFVPPEVLERFGGARRLACAVDDAIDHLAALLPEPARLGTLFFGPEDTERNGGDG